MRLEEESSTNCRYNKVSRGAGGRSQDNFKGEAKNVSIQINESRIDDLDN